MLTKHRAILTRNTRQGENTPYVEFRNDDEETGVSREIHVMRYNDWVDMGKPDEVTLTVRPGDRLNTPEEPKQRRIMLDKPEDYDAEYGD